MRGNVRIKKSCTTYGSAERSADFYLVDRRVDEYLFELKSGERKRQKEGSFFINEMSKEKVFADCERKRQSGKKNAQ